MQEIQELDKQSVIGRWIKTHPIHQGRIVYKSEYLYLIWLGYSDEAIRHGLDMSKECYFIYRLTLLNE